MGHNKINKIKILRQKIKGRSVRELIKACKKSNLRSELHISFIVFQIKQCNNNNFQQISATKLHKYFFVQNLGLREKIRFKPIILTKLSHQFIFLKLKHLKIIIVNTFVSQQLQFSMQDYPKTQCLYHPLESITNFCKQKSCLMPLCPTCICSHMDMHISQGKSNPRFDNINEAFNTMSQEIRKFNDKFMESDNQLIDLDRTISSHKKNISDLIFTTKIQVRDIVETSFNELEKELIASITKQNQTRGLHVPESLDLLKKGIIEISGKLLQMKDDLKTEKALSCLITFNHETKANIEKYQQMISKEIKNNEEYSPIASINHAAVSQIKHSLTQLISLKFNLPLDLAKPLKVLTEDSEITSPSIKSPKLNISINENLQKLTAMKTPSNKTPLARTCINSLRSSFGNLNKTGAFTTNKSPVINTKIQLNKVSSPLSSTSSPLNINKFLGAKVASSLKGVQKRQFEASIGENRF